MLKVHIYDKKVQVDRCKIKILYNLSELLEVNGRFLSAFDMLLVNANDNMTIRQREQGGMLYAIFYLDNKELSRLFRDNQLSFSCDSSQEKNDNFVPLRDCLTRLLLANSEVTSFAKVAFQEYSYKLYLLLMNHFRVSKLSLNNLSLSEQFEQYVAEHFQTELSLSKICSDFFMTPQYFSKLFKETMGVTFYKYLTAVRLEQARNLLADEDMSILQVALDSGFANINAFNRAYKEKFQELPSDYRKRQEQTEVQYIKPAFQELSHILKGQLTEEKPSCQKFLDIDVENRELVKPYWQKVINVGKVSNLNQKRIEEQFRDFQSEMHFEYARLKLEYPEDFNQNYSYYGEESYMDFLVKLNLRCQFVIDFRDWDGQSLFQDYLKGLISHLSNRYSIERLRQWRFELDYLTLFDDDKCRRYASAYQRISKLLESYGMEESLYGPGFILGDISSFRIFTTNLKKGIIPDIEHLTFHVLPNIANKDTDNNLTLQTVTDVNHIKNQLETIQSELAGESHRYHIVEWQDYQPYHPWINDSTFKAADIIKNTLACLGMLDDLAWGPPLDLLLDDRSDHLLSGGEGCVTKHGVKKPSYYAHSFLSCHGRDIIAADDYSLVTSSGHNLNVVCHNCSQLNYRYYLQEDKRQIYHYNDYFEQVKNQRLVFQFKGMKNGTYLIKTRRVNSNYGSVQDLMSKIFLDGTISFGESEIDYLKTQAVPKLTLFHSTVEDGRLELQIDLEPNEICYMHVIYLY